MSRATLSGLRDYLYSTLSPADMLWLGTQLTEYARNEEYSLKPYAMKEINAMLDQVEADFTAGMGIPHEDVVREMEEDIRKEREELKMAKAV